MVPWPSLPNEGDLAGADCHAADIQALCPHGPMAAMGPENMSGVAFSACKIIRVLQNSLETRELQLHSIPVANLDLGLVTRQAVLH